MTLGPENPKMEFWHWQFNITGYAAEPEIYEIEEIWSMMKMIWIWLMMEMIWIW